MSGALAPQIQASAQLSLSPALGLGPWLSNLLLVLGTLGALLAFRFTPGLAARPLGAYALVAGAWGRVGRVFILVAFGALFASLLIARVSALVGQLYFLLHDWLGIVK